MENLLNLLIEKDFKIYISFDSTKPPLALKYKPEGTRVRLDKPTVAEVISTIKAELPHLEKSKLYMFYDCHLLDEDAEVPRTTTKKPIRVIAQPMKQSFKVKSAQME